MGELTDYLSGSTLPDTHDERFRQGLARHLVERCGFDKAQINQRQSVTIHTGSRTAQVRVDFVIRFRDKTRMMVRYAPGSLVTRRLSNLALSRIIHDYQIPVVVTTNGRDAEIINGVTGEVTGQGLSAIPKKADLDTCAFPAISPELKEKASRIAYACEVDGACPCDTDICVLENDGKI